MSVEIVKGNLFDTDCEVIAHQVNCAGVMGSGVAKQVREKYPEVFKEYKNYIKTYKALEEEFTPPVFAGNAKEREYEDHNSYTKFLLGRALIIKVDNNRLIANLFGQESYGLNQRHTNYEAIYKALENTRNYMRYYGLTSIALPYKMSCDRAGGNWGILKIMIEEILEELTVKIYDINP